MSNSVSHLQEYSLALHQCFDRYIQWVEVKIGESIYTTSLTEQNLGTEETNNGEQKTMTVRQHADSIQAVHNSIPM